MLTAEEAQKNPVGKGREAPQPLDEPKFEVSFLIKPMRLLFLLVDRKHLFFGLHRRGKPCVLLSGVISNGQLLKLHRKSSELRADELVFFSYKSLIYMPSTFDSAF